MCFAVSCHVTFGSPPSLRTVASLSSGVAIVPSICVHWSPRKQSLEALPHTVNKRELYVTYAQCETITRTSAVPVSTANYSAEVYGVNEPTSAWTGPMASIARADDRG